MTDNITVKVIEKYENEDVLVYIPFGIGNFSFPAQSWAALERYFLSRIWEGATLQAVPEKPKNEVMFSLGYLQSMFDEEGISEKIETHFKVIKEHIVNG